MQVSPSLLDVLRKLPTPSWESFGLGACKSLRELAKAFLGLGSATLIGILAGKAVLAYAGTVCLVEGISMEPTYRPGDRVLTKPVYGAVGRGEIVLLHDGRARAVKRVIGLPGESLELWRGYIFINGHMLREPYLPKYTYTFPDQESTCWKYKLRDTEYFVMGDNRQVSIDSRCYGPIAQDQIIGRVPETQTLRPELTANTLPALGKRTIRSLSLN
jgi:signal peptidase I